MISGIASAEHMVSSCGAEILRAKLQCMFMQVTNWLRDDPVLDCQFANYDWLQSTKNMFRLEPNFMLAPVVVLLHVI